MKRVQIELFVVLGVLQNDDVFTQKRLVRQEVLEVFGLDVELIDGFMRKHVAGGLDCSNVSAIVKNFKHNGTMRLSIGIFVKIQLCQLTREQRFPGDGIHFELFEVGDDMDQIEDVAVLIAIWIFIGLKTQ